VLLGSTALDVALRAAGPVAIVPAEADLAAARAGVVLGVDAADVDEAALRLAFERAERLREPLTAMHVRPVADDGSQTAAEQTLDAVLAPWRRRHRDVTVEARAVTGDPAAELRATSRTAESVVLGAGRRSALLGVALGSVSHALLHDAAGPVVVAR
jgi:nucleotide-binding universal stress UspA family protein